MQKEENYSKVSKTVKNNDELDPLSANTTKTNESLSRQLLAYCSELTNQITLVDLETEKQCIQFEGVTLRGVQVENSITFLEAIPNSRLLISLQYAFDKGCNMKIFDISQKDKASTIYTFEEMNGEEPQAMDMTYNSRRNLLAAISVEKEITYHLFKVGNNCSRSNYDTKLLRKTQWHTAHEDLSEKIVITSLDFEHSGEVIAVLDSNGLCLISDVNTNSNRSNFNIDLGEAEIDFASHCRWSTNIGEPLLFVKYLEKRLNIIDVEKRIFLLETPFKLDKKSVTAINVCPNNGSLLAVGTEMGTVKVYDRRQDAIVQTWAKMHENEIRCVRWDSRGDKLVSTASDRNAKLIDSTTGKVIFKAELGNIPDDGKL